MSIEDIYKVGIEEYVLNDFRRMLGLANLEEVPGKIIEMYVELKRMKDVCGSGKVTPNECMLFCVATGNYHRVKKVVEELGTPKVGNEEVKEDEPEQIKPGSKVTTKFRDEQCEGILLGYDDEDPTKCLVKIKGDDKAKRFCLVADTVAK